MYLQLGLSSRKGFYFNRYSLCLGYPGYGGTRGEERRRLFYHAGGGSERQEQRNCFVVALLYLLSPLHRQFEQRAV